VEGRSDREHQAHQRALESIVGYVAFGVLLILEGLCTVETLLQTTRTAVYFIFCQLYFSLEVSMAYAFFSFFFLSKFHYLFVKYSNSNSAVTCSVMQSFVHLCGHHKIGLYRGKFRVHTAFRHFCPPFLDSKIIFMQVSDPCTSTLWRKIAKDGVCKSAMSIVQVTAVSV
jgi:hypothetical protein